MDGAADERILVIPRLAVADLEIRSGFVRADASAARRFVAAIRTEGTFVLRDVAEREPEHIQPIALAYIEHDDRLLVLQRDHQDRSDALRGRDVLWVGGHIEAADAQRGQDPIAAGLRREIEEELLVDLPADLRPELVGLVADDATPRSWLHVGLVHRVVIDDPAIGGAACGGALRPIDALLSECDRLEPWSLSILEEHLRPRWVRHGTG